LLVDDDPAFMRSIGRLLKGRGIQSEMAATTSEGVRLAAKLQPRAIILDLFFTAEGATGFDVLPQLQQAAPRSPVLMLTGSESKAVCYRAFKEGVVAFVGKGGGCPLIEALDRVLKRPASWPVAEEDRHRRIWHAKMAMLDGEKTGADPFELLVSRLK